MHFNFQKHQSKQLVQDYVSWRLFKHDYPPQWNISNKIDLNKNSKIKICLVMRQMAYEFEKHYERFNSFEFQFEPTDSTIKDILNSILIDLFELNNENLIVLDNENKSDSCINFSLLARDTNSLKCSWSKIVALFAFSGKLACKLHEIKSSNLIYNLVELLTDFINNDKRIFSWISSQGSWNDGLVEYFNERRSFLKFDQSEFNLNDTSDSDDNFRNRFSNFTNNSCISRPASPTQTLFSRSLSDSALDRDTNHPYLHSLQNQFKNTFFKLSQYAALGVGSIGKRLI